MFLSIWYTDFCVLVLSPFFEALDETVQWFLANYDRARIGNAGKRQQGQQQQVE
jgi:hypothetical protein